jgi:hypothetical protein
MLAVLECLGDFIKHGVSFLVFPTDFQALSFTSPQTAMNPSLLQFLQKVQRQNARISRADAGISI